MSPTVFREGPYRFFFFSREEARIHVHVRAAEREAKFWISPVIELAINKGFKQSELGIIRALVETHVDEIRTSWAKHFNG